MLSNKERRVGAIARKVGMTRFWDNGRYIPVTLLHASGNIVLRSGEKAGHHFVLMSYKGRSVKNVNKPMRGLFNKQSVPLANHIKEFRVSEQAILSVGSELSLQHFVKGQLVDVTGTSIGKGFAGVMKRHNFAGLKASHGVSIKHRSGGSTGQCQDPGRVFKGKKMAGHMGAARRTVQNLQIVGHDEDLGVILVKGSVPGNKGDYLYVQDAVKVPLHNEAMKPGNIKSVVANKQLQEQDVAEAKE